jgi:uncharacterized metal-binding protein
MISVQLGRIARRDCGVAFCIVIASEAKQSISPLEERMDCFVASLLAMTEPAV